MKEVFKYPELSDNKNTVYPDLGGAWVATVVLPDNGKEGSPGFVSRIPASRGKGSRRAAEGPEGIVHTWLHQ